MFNSLTFLQEGAQKVVDLYMGTMMSVQRPTGWIGFFTLQDVEKIETLEDGTLLKKTDHLAGVAAIIDLFTLTDMIMRMKEVNFGDADITLSPVIMPDGKVLVEDYAVNNKFTVQVLESSLTSMSSFFSTWQREIYNPERKALRAYSQRPRDREPYKRDFVSFYINWYANVPIITHFKGASGVFPLKYTLNDETRSYENDSPGVVSVELAADSINTIIVNQGTLFKDW